MFLCGQYLSASGWYTSNLLIELQASSGAIRITQGYTTSQYFTFYPNLIINDTDWHHLALVRDSNDLVCYLDGVAGSTTHDVTGMTFTDQSSDFIVGRGGAYPAAYFAGWLDEFRLDKGTAIWTEDFIPPVLPYAVILPYNGLQNSPAGMHVWDVNFKAVYHMNQDPSAGADCILDSTQNVNHGTSVGTMLTEDLVNGVIGKGIVFDGTDDYIQVADSVDFSGVGTADFNITMVCTFDSITTSVPISIGSYTDGIMVYIDSGTSITVYVAGVTEFGIWTWNHAIDTFYTLEIKRVSGTVSIFVDNTALSLSSGKTALSAAVTTTAGMRIAYGYAGGANNELAGTIHEVCFAHAGRTTAWSKANYNSLMNKLLTIAKKV